MLNICCIQTPEDSAQYVDILADMVARNISDKQSYKFICFTDTPEVLDSEIDVRPLMEKNRTFPEGDHVLFLDLNIVIVGGLDEFIKFKGPFSELPKCAVGSAVVSYKDAINEIPKNSRVIVFDGDVRPHEVTTGWMPNVWKIGGGTTMQLEHVCNTSELHLVENIKNALKLPFPWLQLCEPHDGHAVIVGGGPSLKGDLQEIKDRQSHGQIVFSSNNTYNWLLENKISPNFHVMIDAREENAKFVPENYANCYYASQCHPSVFEAAKDKNVILWHSADEGIQQHIGDNTGDPLVGGQATVGLKSIALAWILGYRNFHLYGFDSSYHDGKGHAYSQPINDNDKIIDVTMNGKEYKTSPWMCMQLEGFKEMAAELVKDGCVITVHGHGLLPDAAKLMTKASEPKKIMNAVYDLSVSPPTYEFLTFLCAAEKARIAGGYDNINIIFQPGPNGGFRADNLPPDIEARKSMFTRICLPACKLLPSVKDIYVLTDRTSMDVEFPVDWSVENPTSCYGLKVMRDNMPTALMASPFAKKVVSDYFPDKYITITIRECSYWPERNSQRHEWELVKSYLEDIGHTVVFIEDAEVNHDMFSWDVDFRTALYQGAVVNLGISNGPMVLCMLSGSPYILFRPVTENTGCTAMEFHEKNGMYYGDQWNETGKVVWENDTAEVIIKEVQEFLKINKFSIAA